MAFGQGAGLQLGGADPDQDPLFYRGKSPVLGRPTELRTAGELPGEFPAAAGPAPGGPTAPGAAPTRPGFPSLPEFTFEFAGGEQPTPPTPPDRPAELFGPGSAPRPWWQGAVQGAELASGAVQKLRAAGQGSAEAMPGWVNRPSLFSLTGGEPGDTLQAGNFSLFGGENAPTLEPGQFSTGFDPRLDLGPYGDTGAGFNAGQGLGGATGLGFGLFNAVTAPTASGKALGAINAGLGADALARAGGFSGLGTLGAEVGGGLGVAGGLYGAITGPTATDKAFGAANAGVGGLALAGSAISPYLGLGLAAMEAGRLLYGQYGPDRAQFPDPYVFIPGSSESGGAGSRAVDPSTGAVMIYQGNGRYRYSDETLKGQRATPEQFKQWNLDPTGALLQQPGYAPAQAAIQQRDLTPTDPYWGNTNPATGGTTRAPTPQHVQQGIGQWRQPYLDAIKAQHPFASEAEIWRLYTLTPEYQQEAGVMAGWGAGPTAPPDR